MMEQEVVSDGRQAIDHRGRSLALVKEKEKDEGKMHVGR